MRNLFKNKTPLKKLIDDIEGPKVVKNFSGKFGDGIAISALSDEELKKLTACLYKKFLFLGEVQQDFVKFNDYQGKYFNYYHLLFNKLKACLNLKNGGTNIDKVNLTTQVRNTIIRSALENDFSKNNNNSYQILLVLSRINAVKEYLRGNDFSQYRANQKEKFNKYFPEKILSDLTLEVAVKAGLKFYRDGANDKLKNQEKILADGFINKDRRFYNRWFIRTDAQELSDVIRDWFKKKIDGDYQNDKINSAQAEVEKVIRQGQIRAVFSLRGTPLYEKILSQGDPIVASRKDLADWEKILWQRKLVEHLTYAFKGEDPFIAPHVDMARKVEKNLGIFGRALLFIFGTLPPSSILLAPVAKESFEKTPVLSYIVLGSYYLTYPVRFLFEYCVLVPIEAPFKLIDSLYQGIFKSDEFDPGLNVFQRIGFALKREDFLHSTTFQAKYESKVDLPNGDFKYEYIVDLPGKANTSMEDEFISLGNMIKGEMNAQNQVKTQPQQPGADALQKELQYSKVADSKYAAKCRLGKDGKRAGDRTTRANDIGGKF